MLYILTDFTQTILFYFLFCTKENFSLVGGLCYILVYIYTDKHPHLIYMV